MKPLADIRSHLRPLLRLPSHTAPQPNLEHFTSNPSLLHHLPNHAGSSHSIVGSSTSAASASGSSGAQNAGRAGWGGAGAGGSGGYTGHARAFLSLPQTSGADASSSLISTSDEKKQHQSRSEIAIRHRLERDRGRHTRLVEIPDGSDGRSEVQREIASRSGGATFAIVDIDQSPSPSSDRRSSIAFPSPRALPGSPSPSHSSGSRYSSPSGSRTPPRRQGLSRSSSNVDLWQVGIPLQHTPLGARTVSTSSSPLPEHFDRLPSTPVIPISTPRKDSASRIPQPNHVLMDLAGLDLPLRQLGRRHNSSLAHSSSRAVDDGVLTSLPSSSTMSAESSAKGADYDIFHALMGAKEWRQRDVILSLVSHYRSPRSVSPFDPSGVAGDPALASKYPLPSGWTVATYNACLESILSVRTPGESIALILEIYNEMLERDLVPNSKTYSFVMRALCFREIDVQNAKKRWDEEKIWGRWRQEHLNARWDASVEENKSSLIEGYESEGNLASALKLFRAAVMLQPAAWHFPSYNYSLLLETLSVQPKPDLEVVKEIFEHAKFRHVHAWRSMYRHIFRAYARAGDVQGMEAIWAEFESMRTSGDPEAEDIKGWFEGAYADQPGADASRIQGFVRDAYQSAIEGFIRLGEVPRAMKIFETMLAQTASTADGQAAKSALGVPPVSGGVFGAVLSALSSNDVKAAIAFHDKYADSEELNRTRHQRFPAADMYQYLDALILAGEGKRAAKVYNPSSWQRGGTAGFMPDRDRVKRVYAGLLLAAKSPKTTAPQRKKILDTIRSLNEGYNGNLPIDYALIREHWNVLEEAKLYNQIPGVLDNFHPKRHGEIREFTTFANRVLEHMDLKVAVTFVLALQRHHQLLTPDVSARVAEAYWTARATTPTPAEIEIGAHGWTLLVRCFANLPPAYYEDGGKDEVLERFMEDLKILQDSKSDQTPECASMEGEIAEGLRGVLTERFGRDRTTEMMSMFPSPSSEGRRELPSAAEASSGVTTPVSGVEWSMPPTPTSMSSAPSELSPSASSNLQIDPQLSTLVDTHCGRNPRVTPLQAYDAVRTSMLSSNVTANPSSLSRLIVSLARLGEETKVVELYNLCQTLLTSDAVPTQWQSGQWMAVENSMIQAACLLGHLEQAGLHRHRLIQAGGAPTADAYATMIASSKDTTDDALVARELFDESQQLGVVPHLYLYNTIISKLSKARKAELALELFAHMKRAGVRPSSVTYGAVINACCRVGDAESAETLFEEMSSASNFKPRVPPFNTMMQFYLQTVPSREKVLHYFTLLRQSGVAPSAHTYKLLLDAYSVITPLDLAAMERVFSELVSDRSVEVSGTHWASVITAHGLMDGDVSRALEIFDAIPAHPTTKHGVEPVVWESMLNVLASKGTLEELENVRTRMIDSNVRPTAYVYNVLISGYARHGRIDLARELFEGMGDSVAGVAAPNNHPLLRTSAGHLKPNTITEGDTGVVYREPSTYESMIRAEMMFGERSRAEEVVARMEARGYPVAVFLRARAMLDDQNVGAVGNGFGYAAGVQAEEEGKEVEK